MSPSPRVREDGVMPGPQDQLSEQRLADHIRPLERNPTVAELRERLERLPPNHPSSPRYDDSPDDAAEPDPGAREFSRPRDSGSQPESAAVNRDLSGGDAPRIHPDGTWEWKGYTLTPAESRCADLALARCRDAEGRNADGSYGEHGLTPAMRRIEAQLEHGRLAPDTEKYALKSPDRFKEKLAERISLMPEESVENLASQIHDGIRYTFIYDYDTYTLGSSETEAALVEGGYVLQARKPAWDSADYKGVNSQWLDPESGLLFEVQFHTSDSWEAKQATHHAYARLTDLRVMPQERARLEEFQQDFSASVPIPRGALEIPYYVREKIEQQ
jgi:hypothetical protein